MDKVYTKSYLKDFLHKVYFTNLENSELASFLSELVTEKGNRFDNKDNNYLLMLILTCINKNNLTYQNQMLINEVINSLLLDQLEENNNETCEKSQPKPTTYVDLNGLDLNDNEAVKAYFLQTNTYLENTGDFPYPPVGKTSIIVSGDNVTIPGIRYIVNYIIDHTGKIVGIQGYPRRELEQSDYENVYSDLINSIFEDGDNG